MEEGEGERTTGVKGRDSKISSRGESRGDRSRVVPSPSR